MMSMPNINIYHFLVICLLGLTVCPINGQERIEVNRADFAHGVKISVSQSEILNSSIIAVRDSMGRQLTLLSVEHGDTRPWLKMTTSAVPTAENTVYWTFDQATRELRIDLSSIVNDLSAGDDIQLFVAPVSSRTNTLFWKITEATSLETGSATGTTILKDLTIEIE